MALMPQHCWERFYCSYIAGQPNQSARELGLTLRRKFKQIIKTTRGYLLDKQNFGNFFSRTFFCTNSAKNELNSATSRRGLKSFDGPDCCLQLHFLSCIARDFLRTSLSLSLSRALSHTHNSESSFSLSHTHTHPHLHKLNLSLSLSYSLLLNRIKPLTLPSFFTYKRYLSNHLSLSLSLSLSLWLSFFPTSPSAMKAALRQRQTQNENLNISYDHFSV